MRVLTDAEREEVHKLLHTLWSRDHDMPGYDKKKWGRLSDLIDWGFGPLPTRDHRTHPGPDRST